MAKVAKPMSLRVKVQMQGLGLPSLCFNSTGLQTLPHAARWGGKACPLLKKGSVRSRLGSTCRPSSHAHGAPRERGSSVLSWAGLGTASGRRLRGGEGSLWFVFKNGISSWGETSVVNESSSGM